MMNQCQDELRKKMARKTRVIVEKQGALELEEFLAQGRKRSRQQRKVLETQQVPHSQSLPQRVVLA